MDPCEDICHNKLKNAAKCQSVLAFCVCDGGRHWILPLLFPFQDVNLVRITVNPGQSGRLGKGGGGLGRRALGGAVSSVAEGFSSLMLSFDSEGSLLTREISRAAGLQVKRRAVRTGSGVLGA